MQIVYLDQNKWIEIASFLYGKRRGRDLGDVVQFIRSSRAQEMACFPLSSSHYQETQVSKNLKRRRRLAEVMWDISGGVTIADPSIILRHELDEALYARFRRRVRADRIEPLRLLGQGIAGVSPDPFPKVRFPEGIPPKAKETIEALIEKGLLSGVNLFTGEAAPRADTSEPENAFRDGLDMLSERLRKLDRQTRERALYALALMGIRDALSEALFRHGISQDEFFALGVDGLTAFVDDLPSQRADVHLRRYWSRNRELRATRTLLIDWGQMGPMVMYCDVVVTEKLFADLINRGHLRKRATVITDLAQLPKVLVEKSRQ